MQKRLDPASRPIILSYASSFVCPTFLNETEADSEEVQTEQVAPFVVGDCSYQAKYSDRQRIVQIVEAWDSWFLILLQSSDEVVNNSRLELEHSSKFDWRRWFILTDEFAKVYKREVGGFYFVDHDNRKNNWLGNRWDIAAKSLLRILREAHEINDK